jgi:hypothetical protein
MARPRPLPSGRALRDAIKTFQYSCTVRGWDAGPFIFDLKAPPDLGDCNPDNNGSPWAVVPDRVIEQIGDDFSRQHLIRRDRYRLFRPFELDVSSGSECFRDPLGDDRRCDAREVDGLRGQRLARHRREIEPPLARG